MSEVMLGLLYVSEDARQWESVYSNLGEVPIAYRTSSQNHTSVQVNWNYGLRLLGPQSGLSCAAWKWGWGSSTLSPELEYQ
jgi:hypothetical protein